MKYRNLLIFFIFLLPASLILSRLGDYAFPQTSQYSDLTISHLPFAEFIRTNIFQSKQIPLWYPGLFGGMPFSSHPLSGLWYPFGWIAILLPAPDGFNLAFAFHMVLAGIGMYLFLRKEGAIEFSAILAGLAFELTPKLFSHWAAGHVTLCYAYSITPWLLLCESYATEKRDWSGVGSTATVLGLILLADVRWAAYAGLCWISFRLYKFLGKKNWLKIWLEWGIKSLSVVLLAALLAAPFILDFFEFTSLSTRVGMSNLDRSRFGLPLNNLFGILYPDFGGYAEWAFYPGAIGLILIVMQLTSRTGWKQNWYWLVFLISSLFLAVDAGWMYAIPGFNLLRVSSRFLFLFNLASAILLGKGIGKILQIKQDHPYPPISWLVGAGVSFLAILLPLLILTMTETIPTEMVWGMIFFAVSLTTLIIGRYLLKYSSSIKYVLLVIVIADLGGAGFSQIRWVQKSEVDHDGFRIANYLGNLGAGGRIYSSNYQIPQLSSERTNLQMISGIDPMQLSSFALFMERATNINLSEYSVPIPPLNEDPISQSNLGIVPEAQEMGWVNVDFWVTGEEIKDPLYWEFVGKVGEVVIYRNSLSRPRAWVQAELDEVGQIINEGTIINYSPNLIEVNADGPGNLVLAEMNYPGWKAFVDGKKVNINEVAGLLRSVNLEAGNHTIKLVYWPSWLTFGIVGNFIAVLIITYIIRKRACV